MTEPDRQNDELPSIPAGTPVYGTEKIEAGIDESEKGYIEITPRSGDSFRFSVPSAEIKEFVSERSKEGPALQPPEGTLDDIKVPDDWENGNVEHTGGGIWLRIFRKPLNDGSVEVSYDPADGTGVQAGIYKDDGIWVGELDVFQVESDSEEDLLRAAHALMSAIDEGKYDGRIEDSLGD